MSLLAFALMAPWLLVLCFAYWMLPRHLPQSRARRSFDSAAIVLALAAALGSTALAWHGHQAPVTDQFGQHTGAIWPEVLAVLYAYAALVAVLLLAFTVRHLAWGRATRS